MEKIETKSPKNAKALTIGAVVGAVVVVVACAAFLTVYLTRVEDKLEWVSYSGHYGDSHISMDEEAEIDYGSKVLYFVNPDGTKAGLNNSISFSDYNIGLQAIRVVGLPKKCFIQNLDDTFEEALEILNTIRETGDSGPRFPTSKAQGELIPQEEHMATLGKYLGMFCSGIPTYRLVDVSESSRQRRRFRIKLRICLGPLCHSVQF